MGTRTLATAALILLTVAGCAGCALGAAAQGADATKPTQGARATPTPASGPRKARPGRRLRSSRGPAAPRFIRVTIVTDEPLCDVAIDDQLEERGTDEQGRLVVPMEPGTYDVRVTKSGYVTDGREIRVEPPPYEQEERFTLRRVLVSLKVKTNPPGVRVFLDGGREGESDGDGGLTFEQVDPSVPHSLRGVKENYREETVIVPPYKAEASMRLIRDLLTLRVKTNPPQAEVYLDDVLKGTSDAAGELIISKVKTDREHSLRAVKEGYVTQAQTVPPNYELAVITLPSNSAALTPADGQASGASSAPPNTTQQPDPKRDESGNPRRDGLPQGLGTKAGGSAAPAAREAEARPTAPQPQEGGSDRASLSLEVELKFWDSIKDSTNPEEFAAYLRKYPEGQFVDLARIRMNALLVQKKAAPAPAETPSAPADPPPTPGDAEPAAEETPMPAPAPTPTPKAAQALAQVVSRPARIRPAQIVGVSGEPGPEETLGRPRKNFAAEFTHRYSAPQVPSGPAQKGRMPT